MEHPPLDVRWRSPMGGPAPSTRVAHTMTPVQAVVGGVLTVLGLLAVWGALTGDDGLGTLLLAILFVLLGLGNLWLGLVGRRRTSVLVAAGHEAQLAFRIVEQSVEFAEDEVAGADVWPLEHTHCRVETSGTDRFLVLACPGREERWYEVGQLQLAPRQVRGLVEAG